jgi:hypothetical protein
MLLLLPFACVTPPPTRAEVLDACELDEQETHPFLWSETDTAPAALSEGCVTALGAPFGVDWEALGATPAEAADRAHPVSAFVAGMYTLLAADVGTVGELRASLPEGALLLVDEVAGGLLASMGDADPARQFYWEYATTVVVDTSVDYEAGCRFSSDPYGIMRVCATWLYNDEPYLEVTVGHADAFVASTLVHEAFHQSPGSLLHVEQDDCAYDVDGEGAYGGGIRWLSSWSVQNAALVPAADAATAASGRSVDCVHIEDHTGFTPCAGSLPDLCDNEAVFHPLETP